MGFLKRQQRRLVKPILSLVCLFRYIVAVLYLVVVIRLMVWAINDESGFWKEYRENFAAGLHYHRDTLYPSAPALTMILRAELEQALQHVLPPDRFSSKFSKVFMDQNHMISNNEYFSAFASSLEPHYILAPTTEQQVSLIIKILRDYMLQEDSGMNHARQTLQDFPGSEKDPVFSSAVLAQAQDPNLYLTNFRVAIRGTGHTPYAGAANIADGIVIDTRGLKGIELSDNKKEVKISAGETWCSVYIYLQKRGVTVAGGRDSNVGVVGLILGGGMSWYSTSSGFACDSVISFDIVLGTGETINVSSTCHSDLFSSLKGGLNNFGVVTSLTMKTIRARTLWGGMIFFHPETFHDLLARTVDFVHDDSDVYAQVTCGATYFSEQEFVVCKMVHTQGNENSKSLRPFQRLERRIPNIGQLDLGTHIQMCERISEFETVGMRRYWTTLTIHADLDLMKVMHKEWQNSLSGIMDADDFRFVFEFHPLTKSMLHNSARAGPNAASIRPSDGPLFVVLINPIWKLEEDDIRIRSAVTELVKKLRTMARERHLLHRYVFANYADSSDKVLEGYGDSRLKMMEVSKKYDPERFFQAGVPGGPKLWPGKRMRRDEPKWPFG